MWQLPARITNVLEPLNISTILLPHTVKDARQFVENFSFPDEVILISLNQTETKFVQNLFEKSCLICFIKGRLTLKDGDKVMKPLQGSIAYYIAKNVIEPRQYEVLNSLSQIGVVKGLASRLDK